MHSYESRMGLPLAQTGLRWGRYLEHGFSDERLRFDPIWDGEDGDKRPTGHEIQPRAGPHSPR
eukprot:343877-Alexandrium_andersonii.AAC.1